MAGRIAGFEFENNIKKHRAEKMGGSLTATTTTVIRMTISIAVGFIIYRRVAAV